MVQAFKKKTGQKTEMVLNEYVPFIGDWCDATNKEFAPGVRCPSWQAPETAGGDPDLRHAKGLHAGRKPPDLELERSRGGLRVRLRIARGAPVQVRRPGPAHRRSWLDNEPGVTCMDWQTGEVNANYWAINLLAMTAGTSKAKSVKASTISVDPVPPPPAPPPPQKIGSTGARHQWCGDLWSHFDWWIVQGSPNGRI